MKYQVYLSYRLRRLLPENTLIQIYSSIFQIIEIYVIISWGIQCDTYLKQSSRPQNRKHAIVGLEEHNNESPLNIKEGPVLKSNIYSYKNL